MRFTLRNGVASAVRELAVTLRRGRFSTLPAIERIAGCGAIRRLKAATPVFGGARGSALRVSFRLGAAAPATLELLRGPRVVRRLRFRAQRSGRAVLRSRGLARGAYRVRLTVGRRTRAAVGVLRL